MVSSSRLSQRAGAAVTTVIVPHWYRASIGSGVSFESVIEARLGGRLARVILRAPILSGLALGIVMRRRPVALIKGDRGSILALWIAALPPARKHGIVLEFILRPDPPLRRHPHYRPYWRWIERPSVRRAMAMGHVLTASEGARYAREYGVEDDRFALVHWPLKRGEAPRPREAATPRSVLASGRTGCDWRTLFEAAKGSDWNLTVVCSQADLPRVTELAARADAQVRSEITREEHDELLAHSQIYVLALVETGSSAGHVRLMDAVEAGVPVVASAVSALAEYAVPGETAVVVPPGDPGALREAGDRLLSDPASGAEMARRARERASEWTWAHYFPAIGSLIDAAGGPGQAARDEGSGG